MKKKSPATSSQVPLKKSKAALILSLISAVFMGLTVLLIILFRKYLMDAEYIRTLVAENYLVGALCLVLVCAVQVVVALVPGELVEIAAGYAFGAVWGTILCVTGIMLGSVAVILLVRRFGRRFVYAFYPKEKMDRLPIVSNPQKRNTLVLVLFLIPGTPKDMLTYAVGLTDMSIPLYLLLTTFARFPSVISSTMGGDAVGNQQYITAIIVFAVTATVSAAGLVLYRYIQKRHEQRRE
ncbi:MAG: TVP38/TMEM64 family protein [Ruminococcaceae bacterium]|nr:TVP38/TMEM64 family protein [Oscillospiraceae bacterium]